MPIIILIEEGEIRMSKKLDSVLEKIKKDYKMTVRSAREECKVPKLFLDSPGLNYVFGGGFPLGRIMSIHGPYSSGKSTLSTYIAGQIQKKYEKPVVVYCDFEYSFDVDFAENLGVDVDNNFVMLRPENGEDAALMLRDLIESDEVGLIILDSVSVISSKSQIEDPNKANFGSAAKLMSNLLRFLSPLLQKHKCSLILVGQERQNVGAMFGPDWKAAFSGQAAEFYSSWMARLTRVEDIKDKDDVLGIKIKIRNEKSKLSNPKRVATINLLFDKGIDSDDEYLDYLKLLGIIEQRGAWFYNEDWGMKVAGKNGVADFLHNNPELYEKVKKQVNDMICGKTILDNEEEKTTEDAWDEYTGELNEAEN